MKHIMIYNVILNDVTIPFIKKSDADTYSQRECMVGSTVEDVKIVVFESIEDYTKTKYTELFNKYIADLTEDEKQILGF